MECPLNLTTWHRGGRPPVIMLALGISERVLTPEEADGLAAKLRFHADFVRLHVKRQRGSASIVRHRWRAGLLCPFQLDGDPVSTPEEAVDSVIPLCAYCYPDTKRP